jgi:hypothetical protein
MRYLIFVVVIIIIILPCFVLPVPFLSLTHAHSVIGPQAVGLAHK